MSQSEFDATQALSPEEILSRVLAATRDIRALRSETTTTIESRDRDWWAKFLRIRSGPDIYTVYTSSENPSAPDESLFYNGVSYTKNADSHDWVSLAPPGWDAADQRAASDFTKAGRPDDERAHMIYGIWLAAVTSPQRLPDDSVDGRRILHLRAGYLSEASFPAAALWPEHVDPENDPSIDLEAAGTVDLWVDPLDFRIAKIEMLLEPMNREPGEAEATMRLFETYSLFNEAQLPGPLPE